MKHIKSLLNHNLSIDEHFAGVKINNKIIEKKFLKMDYKLKNRTLALFCALFTLIYLALFFLRLFELRTNDSISSILFNYEGIIILAIIMFETFGNLIIFKKIKYTIIKFLSNINIMKYLIMVRVLLIILILQFFIIKRFSTISKCLEIRRVIFAIIIFKSLTNFCLCKDNIIISLLLGLSNLIFIILCEIKSEDIFKAEVLFDITAEITLSVMLFIHRRNLEIFQREKHIFEILSGKIFTYFENLFSSLSCIHFSFNSAKLDYHNSYLLDILAEQNSTKCDSDIINNKQAGFSYVSSSKNLNELNDIVKKEKENVTKNFNINLNININHHENENSKYFLIKNLNNENNLNPKKTSKSNKTASFRNKKPQNNVYGIEDIYNEYQQGEEEDEQQQDRVDESQMEIKIKIHETKGKESQRRKQKKSTKSKQSDTRLNDRLLENQVFDLMKKIKLVKPNLNNDNNNNNPSNLESEKIQSREVDCNKSSFENLYDFYEFYNKYDLSKNNSNRPCHNNDDKDSNIMKNNHYSSISNSIYNSPDKRFRSDSSSNLNNKKFRNKNNSFALTQLKNKTLSFGNKEILKNKKLKIDENQKEISHLSHLWLQFISLGEFRLEYDNLNNPNHKPYEDLSIKNNNNHNDNSSNNLINSQNNILSQNKYFDIYLRQAFSKIEFIILDTTKLKNIPQQKVEKIYINNNTNKRNISFAKFAHEFKTPLNSILSLISNIKNYLKFQNSADNEDYQIHSYNCNNNVENNINIINKKKTNSNQEITNCDYNSSNNWISTTNNLKHDLNIIKGLSNYTLFLISDIIQYCNESDENENNELGKELNPKKEQHAGNKNSNKAQQLRIVKEFVSLRKILYFNFEILKALISCNETKAKNVKPFLIIEDTLNNCKIKTDEFRLNQIILNLISNAVKFTRNGKITIKVEIADQEDGTGPFMKDIYLKELNSNSEKKENIIISIEDSGMGIKKDQQTLIFCESKNLNLNYEVNKMGSGLGLSICKNISEKLGYFISFESKENKGTKFLIHVPIHSDSVTDIESSHKNSNPFFLRNKTLRNYHSRQDFNFNKNFNFNLTLSENSSPIGFNYNVNSGEENSKLNSNVAKDYLESRNSNNREFDDKEKGYFLNPAKTAKARKSFKSSTILLNKKDFIQKFPIESSLADLQKQYESYLKNKNLEIENIKSPVDSHIEQENSEREISRVIANSETETVVNDMDFIFANRMLFLNPAILHNDTNSRRAEMPYLNNLKYNNPDSTDNDPNKKVLAKFNSFDNEENKRIKFYNHSLSPPCGIAKRKFSEKIFNKVFTEKNKNKFSFFYNCKSKFSNSNLKTERNTPCKDNNLIRSNLNKKNSSKAKRNNFNKNNNKNDKSYYYRNNCNNFNEINNSRMTALSLCDKMPNRDEKANVVNYNTFAQTGNKRQINFGTNKNLINYTDLNLRIADLPQVNSLPKHHIRRKSFFIINEKKNIITTYSDAAGADPTNYASHISTNNVNYGMSNNHQNFSSQNIIINSCFHLYEKLYIQKTSNFSLYSEACEKQLTNNNKADKFQLSEEEKSFNYIVIIDDNMHIRSSIKKTIEKILIEKNLLQNFIILEGNDGIDMLKYVVDPQYSQYIKLIITDENMEFIQGSTAIRIIRDLEKLNKVRKYEIYSATSNEDRISEYSIIEAGANLILKKPFTKDKLLAILDKNKTLES